MKLTEPTQTKFVQAQTALTNIMRDYSAQIDIKKGSVIRQLLIRPYAYIYAKIDDLISSWINKTSVAYLSQSVETSNSIADLVASNYFVTRKSGRYASGIVTINCSVSQIRVNAGARFFIDSINFTTDKTCIASPSIQMDTQAINYVKMYKTTTGYRTNIPVVAETPGELQIAAGALVEIQSNIEGARSAQLLSPITGGAAAETDAQMMQRCKERCGSAIGTLQAIRTKMQDAPVNVISCGAVGSGSPGCFRDRYNNLALPRGGLVDIYVKTCNQNNVAEILLDIQNKKATISQDLYAGLCRVKKLNGYTGKYTVKYGQIAQRGGVEQVTQISFASTPSGTVTAEIQYMPGVKQLQNFMNDTYGGYLGQDCQVKAAVPATIDLSCKIYSTQQISDQQLQDIKKDIAGQINSKQVGDYNLNMDQIAQAVQRLHPNIKLRVPYKLSIKMPTTNGKVYTFNTTDGTASLLYRNCGYEWVAQAYFYSTTPENIKLQVVS